MEWKNPTAQEIIQFLTKAASNGQIIEKVVISLKGENDFGDKSPNKHKQPGTLSDDHDAKTGAEKTDDPADEPDATMDLQEVRDNILANSLDY